MAEAVRSGASVSSRRAERTVYKREKELAETTEHEGCRDSIKTRLQALIYRFVPRGIHHANIVRDGRNRGNYQADSTDPHASWVRHQTFGRVVRPGHGQCCASVSEGPVPA